MDENPRLGVAFPSTKKAGRRLEGKTDTPDVADQAFRKEEDEDPRIDDRERERRRNEVRGHVLNKRMAMGSGKGVGRRCRTVDPRSRCVETSSGRPKHPTNRGTNDYLSE